MFSSLHTDVITAKRVEKEEKNHSERVLIAPRIKTVVRFAHA